MSIGTAGIFFILGVGIPAVLNWRLIVALRRQDIRHRKLMALADACEWRDVEAYINTPTWRLFLRDIGFRRRHHDA